MCRHTAAGRLTYECSDCNWANLFPFKLWFQMICFKAPAPLCIYVHVCTIIMVRTVLQEVEVLMLYSLGSLNWMTGLIHEANMRAKWLSHELLIIRHQQKLQVGDCVPSPVVHTSEACRSPPLSYPANTLKLKWTVNDQHYTPSWDGQLKYTCA